MNRNNIIAEIQEKDLEQLQKIMKQVFNSNTSNSKAERFYEVSKNNSDIYVLGYYIENNLVGTVTLNILTMPSGKEATIWNLAVFEEYRKSGIATKLMIKAEEIVIAIFVGLSYTNGFNPIELELEGSMILYLNPKLVHTSVICSISS